eukprot:CAMPEP_0196748498 /NCGR_PEP_ID=MMETSP1091-20130531/73617_1 /TAXON_ID=302021 /ORGANISM="Rhodomonas sp., Strain CCMP768" /LENGTH=76 /DNA_ID=CAMNT_0042095819 /DNA_START=44 /DNA_END=270 /DNA_ORIENTATION=+
MPPSTRPSPSVRTTLPLLLFSPGSIAVTLTRKLPAAPCHISTTNVSPGYAGAANRPLNDLNLSGWFGHAAAIIART